MKVLAIDQGTTATKSFTLDGEGRFESVAAFEHRQSSTGQPHLGQTRPLPVW